MCPGAKSENSLSKIHFQIYDVDCRVVYSNKKNITILYSELIFYYFVRNVLRWLKYSIQL